MLLRRFVARCFSSSKKVTKYRLDYKPPDYFVDDVDMFFDLGMDNTLVRSSLKIRRANTNANVPLILDKGLGLNLLSSRIRLNNWPLKSTEYEEKEDCLIIHDPPRAPFYLDMETSFSPKDNTALEGLYKSGDMLVTQCEPEGFRKISCFVDRPDVMSKYTVTLVGDKKQFPVLLSNGNLVESGDMQDGKHYAIYSDPFKKPSYLFAVCAGDLACVEDEFVRCNGKPVKLRIYVEHGAEKSAEHAMVSLKHSMAWDEKTFGRVYDLDLFNIVAVSHFNMGAMENKSLNIFNSKYVLADNKTATDADYNAIESIIGHEYFHNWSGNRVTCRDWFQLSLKEGFTVFRDQEFSGAMNGHGITRVENVWKLKAHQFIEDMSALSHPVRPDSYTEMNNFYTSTVYNKGAEVVRMLQTLLGKEDFRKGCDLYFERHDGQAVTCDDFVQAMQDTRKDIDLNQFKLWYSQAGTPTLTVKAAYHSAEKSFALDISQDILNNRTAQPMHIPLALAFFDSKGNSIPIQLEGESRGVDKERVVSLREKSQNFKFINVPERPAFRLLGDFSAPVDIKFKHVKNDLKLIAKYDYDIYSRWDSFAALIREYLDTDKYVLLQQVTDVIKYMLVSPFFHEKPDEELCKFLPLALNYKGGGLPLDIVVEKTVEFQRTVAVMLHPEFEEAYKTVLRYPQTPGTRAFKNTCVHHLCFSDSKFLQVAKEMVFDADCMTNSIQGLSSVVTFDHTGNASKECLQYFLDAHRNNSNVISKWLFVQSSSKRLDTFDHVAKLVQHPAFDVTLPNHLYSLLGGFVDNTFSFHTAGKEAYEFTGDWILKIDKFNPLVACRLARVFSTLSMCSEKRQKLMLNQVELLLQQQNQVLSSGLREILQASTKIQKHK